MHISFAVDPEKALELRNPKDIEISRKSYWQFLSSGEITDGGVYNNLNERNVFYLVDIVISECTIMLHG